MGKQLKRLSTVCRWGIGIALLALFLAGITAFPAHASNKGTTVTIRHQFNHASGKSASPSWKVVSSPNIGPGDILADVAVVSANDIWAVGSYHDTSATEQTLIEHWNGSTWSIVSSPNIGAGDFLVKVAATSTNDVWAVGGYDKNANGGLQEQTLIEHWDGSTWSIVSSPNAGTKSNDDLQGVTAISPANVWTVGFSYTKGIFSTLIEHWNGKAWHIVSSPNMGTLYSFLEGVAAVSANDVWAVGYYGKAMSGTFDQTLVEHWNGSTWSIVSSPNIGSGNNDLLKVAVVSANDAWAVGDFTDTSGTQTLTEHWDGSTWSVVSSPHTGTLSGIAVVSASDIWAVGNDNTSVTTTQTLTEHWDGSAWSVVSSPNVRFRTYLERVAVVSANDIWAVGYTGIPGNSKTVIEHYS